MNTLPTIRYMGIKSHLLDKIIPAIKKVTPENGVVLDLMAGSNTVSYALKEFFTVYTNDVQKYSEVISKAVIENQSETISSDSAKKDLSFEKNKEYHFFEQTYSGTYFSKEQCIAIDNLRYAIEQVENEYKKDLYLLALMCAMCKVQSTPGHFAQFMPSEHKRIIPLQKMDLLEVFYEKCDNYSELCFTDKKNKCFCGDYKELLFGINSGVNSGVNEVDTIYLDSPYSGEQYSRFYHILETVVKYDSPSVNFKAKYREDRFRSGFCYKNRVKDEFENIMSFCKTNGINLVISYSNKGVLPVGELETFGKNYFKKTELLKIDYKHSTQGKGSKELEEVVLICSN